jgi:hypothetical protein
MDSVDPLMPIIGVTCLGIFIGWLIASGTQAESLSNVYASFKVSIVAFGALLASPVFFYMTWQQFGAKARLQSEHLPPCNVLGHAALAQGGRAPRYTWRFEARDDAAKILQYYETECPKSGWTVERKKNGLLFVRPDAKMEIWSEKSGDKEQIVFHKNPPLAEK